MARSIRKNTNVRPPDSDYTFGAVRDNPGDNTGTRVNERMIGDQMQFFEKLMFDSGLSFNELPENAYSGFQFNQALSALINGRRVWKNFALLNSWTINGAGFARWRFLGGALIQMVASLTVPAGVNPDWATFPTEWVLPGSTGATENAPTVGTPAARNGLHYCQIHGLSSATNLKMLRYDGSALTSGDVIQVNHIFTIDAWG